MPAVPEPSVDGSHHPGVARAIECVDSFAEPSCTNELRLEAHVVDGHYREDTTPLREPFADPPLVRPVPEELAAEEHSLELPRLRGRQSRLREYLHDLIRELPLFRRKYRRVAVPAQTSANVLVEPRAFTRDLIRESMQVPDLLEQRLKFVVGNRHGRPGVRPLSDKSFPTSPFVLGQQNATKFRERVGPGSSERSEDPFSIIDRQREDHRLPETRTKCSLVSVVEGSAPSWL